MKMRPIAAVTTLLILAVLAVAIGGCARWSISPDSTSLLRKPKMSPDSVVLEVAIVDVPDDQTWDHDTLWQEVDEQQIPVEMRRRLLAHGIRCGLLGTRLPETIREQLARQRKNVELENQDGAAVISNVAMQHRLQCRPGKARPVMIGKGDRKLVVESAAADRADDAGSSNDDDGETPETDEPAATAPPLEFDSAQCELLIAANPTGDGTVQVTLAPQIRHGPVRQRWVAQEGVFHIDMGRDCETFDGLRIETTLAPGQTWVLASTPAAKGAGFAFFGDNPKDGCARTIVLVRLAQTQQDDLFAPLGAASADGR